MLQGTMSFSPVVVVLGIQLGFTDARTLPGLLMRSRTRTVALGGGFSSRSQARAHRHINSSRVWNWVARRKLMTFT